MSLFFVSFFLFPFPQLCASQSELSCESRVQSVIIVEHADTKKRMSDISIYLGSKDNYFDTTNTDGRAEGYLASNDFSNSCVRVIVGDSYYEIIEGGVLDRADFDNGVIHFVKIREAWTGDRGELACTNIETIQDFIGHESCVRTDFLPNTCQLQALSPCFVQPPPTMNNYSQTYGNCPLPASPSVYSCEGFRN